MSGEPTGEPSGRSRAESSPARIPATRHARRSPASWRHRISTALVLSYRGLAQPVRALTGVSHADTPQKLSKRQKELLAEFERQSSGETHPESAGFFAKVKEFLDGFGNHPDPA